MTCVGHSLGAHICGMVSKHLTSKQHKIIGNDVKQIIPLTALKNADFFSFISFSGLDPARPLIEQHASHDYRLTRDDADVVQIIHTNAGTLGQVSFTGSLDLCINGGRLQPFCRRGLQLSKMKHIVKSNSIPLNSAFIVFYF